MKDDDLEERLSKWQPADPPADLMRRLRAAEPPASDWLVAFRALDRWSWPWNLAACVGALAALALVWLSWLESRYNFPMIGKQVSIEQSGSGIADGRTLSQRDGQSGSRLLNDRIFVKGLNHDSLLNLSSFTQSTLQFAALGNGRNTDSPNGFRLDSPVGPMRLDCGYTPPMNELGNYPFGWLRLNASDRF